MDWLIPKWGLEPVDWNVIDEDAVRRLDKDNPIVLRLCNETSVALAFAVLKLRASCPPDVVRMALAGLRRTAILVKDSNLGDDVKASWNDAITKMRDKLTSLPTVPEKP